MLVPFSSSSMHCFEGPDWIHLKRGRECFPRGPLVKVDPLGRCAVVLVHGLQMIVLKAAEVSLLIFLNFVTYLLILKNCFLGTLELYFVIRYWYRLVTVYIGLFLVNLTVELNVRLALV